MCERPLLHVQLKKLKDSQKSCICQSKYLNGTIKTTMAVLCQICPYLEARNISLELIITNATVKSCIFFLCYSYFYCSKCIHNLLNHGVYNLLPIIITPNLHLFILIFPQYDPTPVSLLTYSDVPPVKPWLPQAGVLSPRLKKIANSRSKINATDHDI